MRIVVPLTLSQLRIADKTALQVYFGVGIGNK
jgi:hypothetical protein